MPEVIVIIDLSSIRPNKESFKSIDKIDELDRYNSNGGTDKEIYEFYYEALADYIDTQLKENKGQQVKKRFIIYFSARSPISLKAEEIIETRIVDSGEYDKDFELLYFVYGNQSLFLTIGSLWKDQNSIVRIITKERWFVSKDLINTFESCFEMNSKIFISHSYEDYSELITKDFQQLWNSVESLKYELKNFFEKWS